MIERMARTGTPVRQLMIATLAGLIGCAPGDTPSSAPEMFTVAFETSSGPFEIEFVRAWSPIAVDRAWTLAQMSYWDGSRIYRVNDRYVQWGYSGRPDLDAEWVTNGIPDEPSRSSNVRGTVSFARGGPGSRSAILFINVGDNSNLDQIAWTGVIGFPPVGRVVSGMDAVEAFYSGYGETPMEWEDSIAAQGNAFLDRTYPLLDSITRVSIR